MVMFVDKRTGDARGIEETFIKLRTGVDEIE